MIDDINDVPTRTKLHTPDQKVPESQIAEIESHSSDSKIQNIEFREGEIVWAKIEGSAHWPAKIKCFTYDRKKVVVVWFNDYRTTKVYHTQLFKFLNNFDEFAKRFHDTAGLKCAAQEALISFGQALQIPMRF